VEGIMAVGAIFGYVIGCYANSLGVGIATAFLAGAICGLLFAFLTVSLQANQNITGLTLTTFGLGLYFFVGNGVKAVSWPVMGNYTNIKQGFADLAIPGLSQIPVIGHGLFNHNLLVYLGIVIAVAMWWYLNHTAPGLRLRSVGENPAAADSVGINVKAMKYLHICLGCGIMGIGGYYMALNMGGSFNSSCWINGYGWIAVALVIFANWSPVLAILGTFVFGFFNTLQVSGSTLAAAFPGALGWLASIPSELYQALPFIITAIVLVVTSIRSKRGSGLPASLGLNYFREER
jgi:simple sugar transport system permease protein